MADGDPIIIIYNNLLGLATDTSDNWTNLRKKAKAHISNSARMLFCNDTGFDMKSELEIAVETLIERKSTHFEYMGSQWSGHYERGNVDVYDEAYALAILANVTVTKK